MWKLVEDELFARLWPQGMPDEERAFLAALPAERRADLVKRLKALDEAFREGADQTRIAGDLGIGRTAFYELRKRWAATRSLKVVAPWASRPGRRKRAAPAVPAHDASGVGTVERADADTLSAPTLRRLAREEARRKAARPAALRARFGREFVIDVSAVDVLVKGEHGPAWLTCAFLLERASGLILAADPGGGERSPSLLRVARLGAARAGELALEVRNPSLDVVVPRPHDWEVPVGLREVARLRGVLGEARVAFSGERRFGVALTDAVGDRVGRLILRPRAAQRQSAPTAAQVRNASSPSTAEIDVLLGVEVRRHNDPIEKRLRRVGLIGGEGDPGPLLRLLDDAFPEDVRTPG